MSKLSPIDLTFLVLERAARPIVMGLVEIFAPPRGVRGADFAESMWRAFVATPPAGKFAMRVNFLGARGPHWEKVRVDLGQHVRRLTLPPPGGDRELLDLAGRLHSTLLDRTRPLWEVFIIDGLAEDEVAVVGRVHHAMFDGISGMRVLMETLNTRASDKTIRPIWSELPSKPPRERTAKPQPSLRQRAGVLLQNLTSLSQQTLQMAGNVTRVTRSGRGWPVFTAAPTCLPKTPFDSMGRSYASAYIREDEISALAKSVGVTVNDVAMTLCDMAMRAYLARLSDRVEQPLVASVAVSTRSQEDDASSNAAALAQTKLGDAGLGPLPRLKQISRHMHELKAAMRKMPAAAQQVLSVSTFGIAQIGDLPILNSALPLTSNLLISNIPPQGNKPLYLGGGRLLRMHGLPILPQNHSANITLASYNGVICFGIVASSAVLPDAWPLAQDIEAAFVTLRDACAPATEVAGQAPKRAARPVRQRKSKSE